MTTEIEWLEARIRAWKAYSMIAWQTKRRLERELEKEKQRNLELKRRIQQLENRRFNGERVWTLY